MRAQAVTDLQAVGWVLHLPFDEAGESESSEAGRSDTGPAVLVQRVPTAESLPSRRGSGTSRASGGSRGSRTSGGSWPRGRGVVSEMTAEDKERHAREALAADEACGDPIPVRALQYGILSKLSYDVPTEAVFKKQLQERRATGPRTSGWRELRQFRVQASAQLAAVAADLERLWVASGKRYDLVAATKMDLPEEPEAKSFTPTGLEGLDRELSTALLKVAPGWFIGKDRASPQEVCVVVAGTQNLSDVLRDVSFAPVKAQVPPLGGSVDDEPVDVWPGQMVHSGFLHGAQQIWQAVLPELQKLQAAVGPLRVTFTGHSLGGAAALLLAAFAATLKPEGVSVSAIYTYGCPHVFYVECWEELGKPVPPVLQGIELRQYVNNVDIVPRILGNSLTLKFAKLLRHLGVDIFEAAAPEADPSRWAATMSLFRFVGPELRLLEPPSEAVIIDQRDAQEAALRLSIRSLVPRGISDHRLNVYNKRLMDRADAVTGYTHQFHIGPEPAETEDDKGHPILGALFQAAGHNLSESFHSFRDDLFERFRHAAGGISERTLCHLHHVTKRNYPNYLVRDHMLDGKYELATPAGAERPELSATGWGQLLEAAIYSDVHWIHRLAKATGWEHTDGELRKLPESNAAVAMKVEDLAGEPPQVACVPLLTPDRRCLTPDAEAAFGWIFDNGGAHPLTAPQKHAFMVGKRSMESPSQPVMCPAAVETLVLHLELAAAAHGHTVLTAAAALRAERFAQRALMELQARDGDSRVCLIDSNGNVSRAGFISVMGEWVSLDEPRAWAALLGLGFGHKLEEPEGGEQPAWQSAALDAHSRTAAVQAEELYRRKRVLQYVLSHRISALQAERSKRRRSGSALHRGKSGSSAQMRPAPLPRDQCTASGQEAASP